ncbi:MAG: hypothetical protein RLZZ450_2576 [Pseudomonadota bacterium]
MNAERFVLTQGRKSVLMHRQSARALRLVTSFAWLVAAPAFPVHAQEVVESGFGIELSAPDARVTSPPPVRVVPAEVPPPVSSCPPPDGTRPDPTLINTDAFVMARFPLRRVFRQLLLRAGAFGTNETQLFQQMWDSMDVKASAKFPSAPHCDDNATPGINGFPIDCPRPEAVEKDAALESMVPVALINRFDLADASGKNCGEYRLIYALKPFRADNRNLIILEGMLPNPRPACGLDACRPVVDFWEGLATLDAKTANGQRALADRMESFYFAGLSGFSPVIDPTNFGLRENPGSYLAGAGQIRTNMFVTGTLWQLREFQLQRVCRGFTCRMLMNPVSVKNNPLPQMFDATDPAPHERAADFHASFASGQVGRLVTDDINMISMDVPDRFNAGQSTSSDPADAYGFQMDETLPNAFGDAIEDELAHLGRFDLTALDVAKRASTQSCAGCHQLSVNEPLSASGSPVWPPSRPDGFVHVDESGFLSEALWCHFLPFRKGVLDAFHTSEPTSCDRRGRPLQSSAAPRAVVVSRSAAPVPPQAPVVGLTVAGRPFGPN